MEMRAHKVSHVKVTTSTDNSTSGQNTAFDKESILAVEFENQGSNDCWITVGSGAAPTAVADQKLLRAGGRWSISSAAFDYFAIINETAGANNTVVAHFFGR